MKIIDMYYIILCNVYLGCIKNRNKFVFVYLILIYKYIIDNLNY